MNDLFDKVFAFCGIIICISMAVLLMVLAVGAILTFLMPLLGCGG